MSLFSPSTDSKDPFQLDRLAEELAARESRLERTDDIPFTDLPDYGPLSHNNALLTSPTFNVEEFLLSRSRASLPELRTELREYLATLKEELVQLINNDYEAFISLSTDLRSEGSTLKKMRVPLSHIRAQALESRGELLDIQNAIGEKLDQRACLREEKALLHLLLKISESVTRLESLLLIVAPEQEEVPANSSGVKSTGHEKEREPKGWSNRAKHIARVASEYMQLLYHVSKAREDACAFVDELQWRIDRIQSTLSSDLDHLFVTLLTDARDNKPDGRLPEVERAKWLADLKECLRTYDALELWRDAEDVLRRELVRPFLRKTVYHNAIGTPRSPILPKTPFPQASEGFTPSLRTPYTPFTAPPPQHESPLQNTHLSVPRTILKDTDNPLAQVYNHILTFVDRDVKDIMELAEKVSSRKVPKETILSKSPTDNNFGGFQILASVVWVEIANAIINNLGDAVFAAGRPRELRMNYDTTRNFLRCLELYAPSPQAVYAMRKHDIYKEFERRWQLPVYFQLRWKEIVLDTEDAFEELRLEPTSSANKASFALPQTKAVWKAITMCWSPDILIPEISHRFWRLTLQLISRYNTWLNSAFTGLDQNVSRTPNTSGETPMETVTVDEGLLRQYAAVIADVNLLQSNMFNLWQQEISIILPGDVLQESGNQNPQEALKTMLSRLTSIVKPASSHVVSILTRRCCEALLPVRSIPSQFRAMSNKRLPTEPSYFIQTIFRPLNAFLAIGSSDGPGRNLKDVYALEYSKEIFDNVAQRYYSYLVAMRKTEESLRKLRKGKKTSFSLFGAAKDEDGRDEERINVQMILDVEAFGKEGQALGVDVKDNEHYEALKNVVLINSEDA